ncbi:hypothetical protein JMJ77_0009439 [Colletotrichum scovillei]|uniref:Uncharacterized protein n=1 Tax=Colletotrichum scovillei TaxID=1209932 RepID=A0A9P7U7U6_9PEZI|nr:hypothetical protein JMJ77_0009439 [Colletotrichum scovillei]KAG7052519.1 hypothetical protein JMJ78_0005535 [Colletotrichum scovillei]KAG7064809.1 hypothetical protein JMJ76_0012567 [Colletotrichum scovillei]
MAATLVASSMGTMTRDEARLHFACRNYVDACAMGLETLRDCQIGEGPALGNGSWSGHGVHR